MPLTIAEGIEIPDDELTFTASRSGGPGGQHVNKTASKVTLRFDVAHAPSSAGRGSRAASWRRWARASRPTEPCAWSARPREASSPTGRRRRCALEALLAAALVPVAPRVATKIPRAEKRRRIESKKRRGGIKRSRAIPDDE